MRVLKRDGSKENVSFDKILKRLLLLAKDLKHINSEENNKIGDVAQKVIEGMFDLIPTSQLDELAAQECMSLYTNEPEFGILGARIIISNNHKNTPDTFSESSRIIYENFKKNYRSKEFPKNIEYYEKFYKFVLENKEILNKTIQTERDYISDYFSFKTLEKSYLIKINNKIAERIQYLFMRVSCGLHFPNLEEVIKSYNLMSQRYFTHASPTLFNAGTCYPQLLSCFLTAPEDSIKGMYHWIGNMAQISKRAGGIGGSISNIRSNGSYIRGTNGNSRGIKPMLKVVNETLKHVNQGGRRPGSAAIYLEPHHPDIMDFLELRLNHGNEDDRCRDLFLAIWASDLFMERVKRNEKWTLFDPDECPGLDTHYGDEYVMLYEKYEREGKGKETIKAQEVWKAITRSQIETGTPYVLFKDNVNRKNNQSNLGTIRGSNLCVTPETKILTDKGFRVIKDLENQYVNVWNGEEFSNSLVMKTGENQDILKIIFDNGFEMKCTKYHKFYTTKSNRTKTPIEMEAKDLKEGTKLWRCKYPIIKEGISLNNPYIQGSIYNLSCHTEGDETIITIESKCFGMVSCNGRKEYCLQCQAAKYPYTSLEEEFPVIKELRDIKEVDNDMISYGVKGMKNYDYVPFDADLKSRLEWLAGYYDSLYPRYGTKDVQVKLLLQTVGIDSEEILDYVKFIRRMYEVGVIFRNKEIIEEIKNIIENEIKSDYNYPFVKVKSIEQVENSDTYCFNEPLKHAGIFNGIYAGQCAEIAEYHDDKEYACCCLSSICLPKFAENGVFNFEMLEEVTGQAVRNLNRVIDLNMYPVPETELSNLRHRPLGIGIQGLAETFFEMRIPFERNNKLSPEADDLNKKIAETMYYGAVKASMEEAKKYGAYETFEGSPISKGIFQFDMWKVKPSDRYDWESLRKDVKKYGVRNSLLIASMPTASTSQIMGYTECIEPMSSNIYVRRTLSGDFTIMNEYMVNDLKKLGMWSNKMKEQIVAHDGSIQYIDGIPQELKDLYKVVWEMRQKTLLDLSVGRAPFVCQTQSLNLFFEEPTTKILTNALFYAWERGLKTGCYYIRSRPKVQAQQFTVDPKLKKEIEKSKSKRKRNLKEESEGYDADNESKKLACSLKNPGSCEACSG